MKYKIGDEVIINAHLLMPVTSAMEAGRYKPMSINRVSDAINNGKPFRIRGFSADYYSLELNHLNLPGTFSEEDLQSYIKEPRKQEQPKPLTWQETLQKRDALQAELKRVEEAIRQRECGYIKVDFNFRGARVKGRHIEVDFCENGETFITAECTFKEWEHFRDIFSWAYLPTIKELKQKDKK